MRYLALALIIAACGKEPEVDVDANTTPFRGFEVISPDITIGPREEITYCYYFHTPNTEEMAISLWQSVMTPGSHHMIMYTTATDVMPPGTISSSSCGGFGSSNIPSWTYAAQMPTAEIKLPADDGTGKPLAQRIPPGTPAYFQMHYVNTSDEAIDAHVKVTATALAVGAAFTQTSPYITYNSQISVDPGQTGDVESQQCNVPTGIQYWSISTHAHKQAVKTEVKDGANVVFTSTDWEHPGSQRWMTTPFYTFASGKLTYECTYDNTGTNAASTVTSGPSAQTDEMCMAIGYFFPATKSLVCLNSLGPF